MNDFVPADSKLEAVTRISALVGAPPETLGPGSKERKSLLEGLVAGLSLSMDPRLDKHQLAEEVACALGMAWTPDCTSSGQTITLVGLNRLLSGVHREVGRRARRADASTAPLPARSKMEAVARISSLTDGPPQTLGPGSKERKSVLVDLADGLGSTVDRSLPKPALAEAIVRELGGSWDDSCWSSGQTITLEGLNRVLDAAERALRSDPERARGAFSTAEKEARALLAVIADALPNHMDGRASVQEMWEAESAHWAQDEWRGFYFEHLVLPMLVNTFGGGPKVFGRTVFDYSLTEVWDLKCHGDDSPEAILNATEAIEACVEDGGFGVLVLEGTTEFDQGDFRQWQRDFRRDKGRTPATRAHPPAYERKSKTGFTPKRLDAFYFADRSVLKEAVEQRVLVVMAQGRQTDGSPRGTKYKLNTSRAAGSRFHIAEQVLTEQ
ncbi:hypothetical protein [Aeromicrobium sp. CnD17-E]|uniref:hypothetical protein n=1 Tax=Aeromicrobium sp. CnD17-E TaxID=2954487 RepID=UPI002097D4B5|nr:hypothetical protein [Aeromicrobium sp. CnD17-E]MCO7237923.1 hypothetical protein [Aeromicrobium sp. CnD17-E]